MTAAAVLSAYAALLLTAGARVLARAQWPQRAPGLAVAAWLALGGSAVTSVILGGLALAADTVSGGLARLLRTCALALHAHYAHPGGPVLAAAGAIIAFAVTARVSWCTAWTLTQAVRARRRHRRGLALGGRGDQRLAAIVVDHAEPAAWCLPGSRGPVVLTTAAIGALGGPQLAAVLAHERAHQRGRHHLLVALAGSLAAAFPRVAAFQTAREQVSRLVELCADDAATAAAPRLTVAEALLALGSPASAPAALAAGGPGTAARIRRLIAAPAPLGRGATVAGILAIAVSAVFPLLVLAGPAVAASGEGACPLRGQHAAAAHPGRSESSTSVTPRQMRLPRRSNCREAASRRRYRDGD